MLGIRVTGAIDVTSAAARRRFFLDRAARGKRTNGAGLLRLLGTWVRKTMGLNVFGDVPAMLIGAHAAAAYAPQRQTRDVDVLVPSDRYNDAMAILSSAGFERIYELHFAHSQLGLFGSTWARAGDPDVDIISSTMPWTGEAFAAPVTRDRDGDRVIGLPYLVLMKLDASRAIDQGDLARTLGRLSKQEVEAVVDVASRYLSDASIGDDIRQYAAIGGWEYGIDR